MLVPRNVVTKEEVVAAMKELAAKFGRAPRCMEVCLSMGIGTRKLRKLFGDYTKALAEAGFAPGKTGGRELKMQDLFADWAAVARKVGRVPTINEYEALGRYSQRPLRARFKAWDRIAAGMLEYGEAAQLWTGWEDVKRLAEFQVDNRPGEKTSGQGWGKTSMREVIDVELLYGEPLTLGPMATAPVNEAGVMILFGALARELGFVIMKVQAGFPDCEAWRRLENGKWQRVRIEFEFESRNFLIHDHDPKGCDLIVCWENNWQACPVEVVELKKAFSTQQSAFSQKDRA